LNHVEVIGAARVSGWNYWEILVCKLRAKRLGQLAVIISTTYVNSQIFASL